MKIKSILVFIFLIVFIAPVSAQKKNIVKLEGENIFLFQELILALSEQEGEIVVAMAPPDGSLAEEYKDIELKENDVVMMMNGRRVKKTSVIREMYEKLEPGDEIKLGIKRGEEMFIVKFEKIDAENSPGKIMIRKEITRDDSNPEEE